MKPKKLQLIASHACTKAFVTPQLSPRISDTRTFRDCSYLSITSNTNWGGLDSGHNVPGLRMWQCWGECILLNSHTGYLVTPHSQANKLCCLEIYTLWSVSRNLWWGRRTLLEPGDTTYHCHLHKLHKGFTVKVSVLLVYFVHLAIIWSVWWSNPPVMSSDHGICYDHSNSPWWASHFSELFWVPERFDVKPGE